MIVAIIGPMGSGKSQLSALLAERQFPVLDLDLVARELQEKPEVIAALLDEFNGEAPLVDASGELARPALARLAFSDLHHLERLNTVMAPFIYESFKSWLDDQSHDRSKPCFVEVSAYRACGPYAQFGFDELWAVLCPDDLRFRRLGCAFKYAGGLASVEARMRLQPSVQDFESWADVCLENTADVCALKKSVDYLLVQKGWL